MIRGLLLAAALNSSRNTRVGGFFYDSALFKNAPQSYSPAGFVGSTCVGNANATITHTSNIQKSTPLTFGYSLPFDNSSFYSLDSHIRFRAVVVVYANNTGYTPPGLPRSEYYYLGDVVLTTESSTETTTIVGTPTSSTQTTSPEVATPVNIGTLAGITGGAVILLVSLIFISVGIYYWKKPKQNNLYSDEKERFSFK